MDARSRIIQKAAGYVAAAGIVSARAERLLSSGAISKRTHKELSKASDELREQAWKLKNEAEKL